MLAGTEGLRSHDEDFPTRSGIYGFIANAGDYYKRREGTTVSYVMGKPREVFKCVIRLRTKRFC